MRLALAALIVAVAVATAAPVPAGAAQTAGSSAKHRCKQKKAKHHHKRRKRCRKDSTGTAPEAAQGEKPSAPAGPPGRLLATERELSTTQLQLQLSRASLASGPTILQQYNAGSDPHNLILERQGAVAFSYPTLDPGLTQTQTVNLARGTWTLYCSLLDHRALGMRATLTVN